MLAMLPSLTSRLRDQIRQLEQEISRRELKPYWELLERAENALYKPHGWCPEAIETLQGEIKEKLGVRS